MIRRKCNLEMAYKNFESPLLDCFSAALVRSRRRYLVFSYSLLRDIQIIIFMMLKSFSACPVHISSHAMLLRKLLRECICFPRLQRVLVKGCTSLEVNIYGRYSTNACLWSDALMTIKSLCRLRGRTKWARRLFPFHDNSQVNTHCSFIPTLCNPQRLNGHQLSSWFLPSINSPVKTQQCCKCPQRCSRCFNYALRHVCWKWSTYPFGESELCFQPTVENIYFA